MSFWQLLLRIALLILAYYLGYETRPVVDRWRPAIQLWINRPRIFPLRKPEPKPTPTAEPTPQPTPAPTATPEPTAEPTPSGAPAGAT